MIQRLNLRIILVFEDHKRAYYPVLLHFYLALFPITRKNALKINDVLV